MFPTSNSAAKVCETLLSTLNKLGVWMLTGRKATAISFDARGSGIISLQIAKRSDKGEREYHESYFVTLTEKWEHFTFTADDFDTELIAVNAINILVIDDTEIYLDNIRFDGISPSMWPSLGMRF